MAKKDAPNTAGDALRDLEQSGDRVAEWAQENAAFILGAIAGILILAAGVGLYMQHGADSREDAASALALVTSQYRIAMGADPAGGGIVEPANQELATKTRTEYAEKYSAVAREFPGTTAGAVAWLEAGNLQAALGQLEGAASSFSAAREEASGLAIGAIASTRLAGLAEDRGAPAAAAEAYEAAAAVAAYPLRGNALTQAARCWVEAGESDRALAVFQRFETEFPDDIAAPQIESLIAEVRLKASS